MVDVWWTLVAWFRNRKHFRLPGSPGVRGTWIMGCSTAPLRRRPARETGTGGNGRKDEATLAERLPDKCGQNVKSLEMQSTMQKRIGGWRMPSARMRLDHRDQHLDVSVPSLALVFPFSIIRRCALCLGKLIHRACPNQHSLLRRRTRRILRRQSFASRGRQRVLMCNLVGLTSRCRISEFH